MNLSYCSEKSNHSFNSDIGVTRSSRHSKILATVSCFEISSHDKEQIIECVRESERHPQRSSTPHLISNVSSRRVRRNPSSILPPYSCKKISKSLSQYIHDDSIEHLDKTDEIFDTPKAFLKSSGTFTNLNKKLPYMFRAKEANLQLVKKVFGKFASLAYKRPWTLILISSLISIILSLKILNPQSETNAERLYALPNTQATRDRELMIDTFGLQPRKSFIIVRKKDAYKDYVTSSDGILNRDILKDIEYLDKYIQYNLSVYEVESKTDTFSLLSNEKVSKNSGKISFQEACYKPYQTCEVVSALEAYTNSRQYGRPLTVRNWPYLANMRKKRIVKGNYVFANPQLQNLGNGKQRLINATALVLGYYTSPNKVEQSMKWEKKFILFIEALKSINDDLTSKSTLLKTQTGQDADNLYNKLSELRKLQIDINAERSWEDELEESTGLGWSEMRDYSLSFTLIALYGVIVHATRVASKIKCVSALCGAIASVLGYGLGAGACYLFGLTYVPTMIAAPFLVLGIGMDDMFVILNAYSLTYMHHNAYERVIQTLQDSGVAITLTTCTNLAAFAVGIISPYLAIRNFCLLIAASLAGGYFAALTFFFPVLCLEARREERISKSNCKVDRNKHQDLVEQNNEILNYPLQDSTRDAKHHKPRNVPTIGTFELVSRIVSDYYTDIFPGKCAIATDPLNKQSFENNVNDIPFNKTCPSKIFSGQSKTKKLNLKETEEELKMIPRQKCDEHYCEIKGDSCTNSKNLVGNQDSDATSGATDKVTSFCTPSTTSCDGTANDAQESDRRELYSDDLTSDCLTQVDNAKTESSDSVDSVKGYFKHLKAFTPNKDKQRCQCEILDMSELEGQRHTEGYETAKLYKEPKHNIGKPYRAFFLKVFGRFLMHRLGKLIVILYFVILTSISIVGICKLQKGLELEDLTPVESYLRDFYKSSRNNFELSLFVTNLFFASKHSDNSLKHWWKYADSKPMNELQQKISNLPMIEDTVNSMQTFLEYSEKSNVSLNATNAVSKLKVWLDTTLKGKMARNDFAFSPDNQQLIGWRLTVFTKNFGNTLEESKCMMAIRQLTDEFHVSHPELPKPVPFSDPYVYFESDPIILKQTLLNMFAAFVVIAVISSSLIKGALSGGLIMMNILIVDTLLFGYMHYWDLQLNILTMILLILSIGFSVDYTVHVVHAFTHCIGKTRNIRMVETIVLMGTPVTHGVISTLLAVTPIAFRDDYISQLFFRMTTMVLLFGYGAGVILLPVILSFVGPKESCKDEMEYGEKSNVISDSKQLQKEFVSILSNQKDEEINQFQVLKKVLDT